MNRTYTITSGLTLFHADAREALKALPDNCVDSVPCDPPYALVSIQKRYSKGDARTSASLEVHGSQGVSPYMRAAAGFMNKSWDTGECAMDPTFWAEVFRVLKPGGHVAAFGSTRGYHRMACAIEDAGFEIRDSLAWMYGTGFPKSHDVAKGIDKLDAAKARLERAFLFQSWMRSTGLTASRVDTITGTAMGSHYTTHPTQLTVAVRDLFEMLRPHFGCDVPDWVEQMVDERTVESENMKRREVVATREMRDTSEIRLAVTNHALDYDTDARRDVDITRAYSSEAAQWEGWGTALKPAFEPIVLARKPLSESTVAANVLRWRTGAMNIDACRVVAQDGYAENRVTQGINTAQTSYAPAVARRMFEPAEAGRWPANVVTDGSDEVVGMFPEGSKSGHHAKKASGFGDREYQGAGRSSGDSGSAARFFYSAKASKADRAGSKHPTVKPIALMQWLARLITPPGGTVLDPFAGSGTTGAAAVAEGFNCVLVEREDEYVRDILARFASPSLVPALPVEKDHVKA